MRFEWDAGNIDHIARHNITPQEAEQVIRNNPLHIQVQIRNGEQRSLYLGETGAGLVLFVAITDRNGTVRVVTAYPANKRARAFYATQKGATP